LTGVKREMNVHIKKVRVYTQIETTDKEKEKTEIKRQKERNDALAIIILFVFR
jgi:hypothetical protein